MTKTMTNHDIYNRIKQSAYHTWQQARDIADDGKWPAMEHSGLGTGWVIKGSVAGFVRQAERAQGRGKPSREHINMVRRFLKGTFNVVPLDKVDDYTFRQFVRAEWNDYEPPTSQVLEQERASTSGNWYERTLKPHEAGAHQAPSEVTVRKASHPCQHCDMSFEDPDVLNRHVASTHPRQEESDMTNETIRKKKVRQEQEGEKPHLYQPLNDHASELMKLLRDSNGEVADKSGFCRSRIHEKTGVSKPTVGATIKTLENNGLVETTTRGRRTYRVALTDRGRLVADNLAEYMTTKTLIHDLMKAVGCVGKPLVDEHGNAFGVESDDPVRIIADEVNRPQERVREAITKLEGEGSIVTHRKQNHRIISIEVAGHSDRMKSQAKSEEEPIKDNGKAQGGVMIPPADKLTEYKQHPDEYSPEDVPLSLSDDELAGQVRKRLRWYQERLQETNEQAQQASQTSDRTKEVIDLVKEAVQSVNTGSSSPLKALGDIETALGFLEDS